MTWFLVEVRSEIARATGTLYDIRDGENAAELRIQQSARQALKRRSSQVSAERLQIVGVRSNIAVVIGCGP